MEEKFKGIVVKLNEYKDADKLASIFSLENGKISAKFTGVKKDTAKFKAIAQPFTFAEFTASFKGQYATITSADLIDNFSNILSNYNKTICGYIVLDMLKTLLPNQKQEKDIFVLTLSSLKNIEEQEEFSYTVDYILKFITLSGMGLQFPENNYVYLDNITGNFVAEHIQGATQIDKKVYQALKNISQNIEIENSTNVLKQCLRLLHNIIYLKFNEDVKAFNFI